jgi:hypothetical protein
MDLWETTATRSRICCSGLLRKKFSVHCRLQGEHVVQLDGLTDDLGKEPMTVV